MKQIIVTGDDFGNSAEVNEAIEQAHRQGILNTASLMVGAEAAEDAIARARRLPSLNVGLHLVLVNGRPVLPPGQVPHLLGPGGAFSDRLVAAGFKFFFRPAVRRQLEAEVRAQFAAFGASGLRLDHVNAHNHMQLHPTVLGLILDVGREYGVPAVRLPYEPGLTSWRAVRRGFTGRVAQAVLLRPWTALMKRRLERAGLRRNDYVFGMNDSGAMGIERVLAFVEALPEGVSELYFHPALGPWPGMDPAMAEYRFADELAALVDPALAEALTRRGIERVGYADLGA